MAKKTKKPPASFPVIRGAARTPSKPTLVPDLPPAKGSKKPKASSKTAEKPSKTAAPAAKGGRKIGERTETVTELLSISQVEAESSRCVAILREIDKAEEDRKNTAASHKSKLSDLRTRLADHKNAASTGKRDREVVIEEWLTERNEVIRIRADTRETIGNRNASRAELQEELPLPPAPEADEDEEDDEDELAEGDLEDKLDRALEETVEGAVEAEDPDMPPDDGAELGE